MWKERKTSIAFLIVFSAYVIRTQSLLYSRSLPFLPSPLLFWLLLPPKEMEMDAPRPQREKRRRRRKGSRC